MKSTKLTAALLCAATMAAMPLIPATQDIFPSISLTAEAADSISAYTTVNKVQYAIYKTSSGSQYAKAISSATDISSIVIPSTITYNKKSVPVTEIASGTFKERNKLSSVDLSVAANLKTIGEDAFYGSSVKYVYIGSNSLTVNSRAFAYTYNLNYVSVQTNANAVTFKSDAFIGSEIQSFYCYGRNITLMTGAFSQCNNLNYVNFGNSCQVITLGDSAFFGLKDLKTVVFSNQNADLYMGKYAFASNYLNSCNLPASTTSIPQSCFEHSVLNNFTLPANLTSIGSKAFQYATLPSTVAIGAKVTSIANDAFTYVSGVKKFTVASGNRKYTAVNDVLYSYNRETLLSYPALKEDTYYRSTAVTIPNGAIYNNTFLDTLSIPYLSRSNSDTVDFSLMPNLHSITIPTADFNQSGEAVMRKYKPTILGSNILTINSQSLVCKSSSGEPYFNSKFNDYIEKYFVEYDNTDFMRKYVSDMAAYVVKTTTTSQMSDMEKALKLHQWIMDRVTYDYSSQEYNHKDDVAASVFLNRQSDGRYVTKCQGYANCYAELMKAANITCTTISSATGNHTWNYVEINGIGYFVDVCWDDGKYEGNGYPFENFMISYNVCKNTHGEFMGYSNMPDYTLSNLGRLVPKTGIGSGSVTKLQNYLNAVRNSQPVTNIIGDMNTDNSKDQTDINLFKVYADIDFDGNIDQDDLNLLSKFVNNGLKAQYGDSVWKWRLAEMQ